MVFDSHTHTTTRILILLAYSTVFFDLHVLPIQFPDCVPQAEGWSLRGGPQREKNLPAGGGGFLHRDQRKPAMSWRIPPPFARNMQIERGLESQRQIRRGTGGTTGPLDHCCGFQESTGRKPGDIFCDESLCTRNLQEFAKIFLANSMRTGLHTKNFGLG